MSIVSFDGGLVLPEPDALPLLTPPCWPDCGADCCVPDVEPPAAPDSGVASSCGVVCEAPDSPVAPDAPPLL